MISLDSETTGLDLRHGAKPFMVQVCDEKGEVTYWEWNVNPLTRQPKVPEKDVCEIIDTVRKTDQIVFQNPKFDVTALATIGVTFQEGWPWNKTRDTLLAGHLLASNQRHDLASMVLIYLDMNIQPYEDAVKKACNEARRWVKSEQPNWKIAKAGLPEMPSAKGSPWKDDVWLLRIVAKEQNRPEDDEWWTLAADYGCMDAEATLALYTKHRELLKEKGLWKIYKERLRVLPVACKIESRGITLNRNRLDELATNYRSESNKAHRVCTHIAERYDYELVLPKSGNNKSLIEFVFGCLKLKSTKTSKKTGNPSIDKSVLEHWEATLPRRSKPLKFVQALKGKRKRDTALSYMESYKKFWLPLKGKEGPQFLPRDKWGNLKNWYHLHPSLNPTGTDTLRWSSQNPNEQNISKVKGFNLRYCFGPAPGREWWSLDAQNIELRIPAYEAGETEMIDLFERMNEGPYYGSVHMLMFDVLHHDKFARYGMDCKKRFESTWYQWTKNGDFAVQYGSVEQSGTADRAYHVPGAFNKIKKRFKKIHGSGGLNENLIRYAERHGYVETMPDKTVNPKRGYPLFCTRTNYGRILPTIPLNYHVQGTACWWMMKAMIRVQAYLDELNAKPGSKGYYMILQVHDELVFDFPKNKKQNTPKIRKIARLMAQGGDDIGVPTPVSIEYHPQTWSEGVEI